MNDLGRETLKQVIEVIRTKPETFDMNYFDYTCGCDTVRCIGGWCAALLEYDPESNHQQAALRMGINLNHWHRLCYVDEWSQEGIHLLWPEQFVTDKVNPWNVTKEDAIARIEHFIATDGEE